MAGVLHSGRHTPSWPAGGEKSDHFVGVCYADYVAATNSAGAEAAQAIEHPEDSLTRELTLRGDAADDLLKRVLAGEREALELWYKTRAWVISGQRKTLARLGIAFDRVFFESDFLTEAAELTASGLRSGRLRRREDGVVFYATGLSDFEEFPLVRADGLPTQHMRALAYWMAAPELEHMTSMQVCGTEWVSHVTCRRKLMDELLGGGDRSGEPHTGTGENGDAAGGDAAGDRDGEMDGGAGVEMHPTRDIFNGMVARQKRAMASSEGALLIDELTDWLDEQIDIDPERLQVRRAHPFPERIAAEVVLGYFLPYPVAPRIDFDTDKLLCEEESLGWDLVRARARHGRTVADGRTATGRGPRLSLRGRAVRALSALSAPGGAALRRPPARALPQAPLALVPGTRARRARRACRAHAARPLRPRPRFGAGPMRGNAVYTHEHAARRQLRLLHLQRLSPARSGLR